MNVILTYWFPKSLFYVWLLCRFSTSAPTWPVCLPFQALVLFSHWIFNKARHPSDHSQDSDDEDPRQGVGSRDGEEETGTKIGLWVNEENLTWGEWSAETSGSKAWEKSKRNPPRESGHKKTRWLKLIMNECGFLNFWSSTSWNCIIEYWGYRTHHWQDYCDRNRNLKGWWAVRVGKLFRRAVSAIFGCLNQAKVQLYLPELWDRRKKPYYVLGIVPSALHQPQSHPYRHLNQCCPTEPSVMMEVLSLF